MDGRFPDHEARAAAIVQHGLPCVARAEVSQGGLVQVRLVFERDPLMTEEAAQQMADEGWDYHISVCYRDEVWDEAALERLLAHWNGVPHTLDVAWVSGNSVAFLAASDAIAQDTDLQSLHSQGRYWRRDLHVSL